MYHKNVPKKDRLLLKLKNKLSVDIYFVRIVGYYVMQRYNYFGI